MKNSIVSFLNVCFLSLIMVACSDNVEPNFSFSPDMPKRGQRVTFTNLTYTQNKLKIDDVLGVWPLHGVCGAFGGIAAGIFGKAVS